MPGTHRKLVGAACTEGCDGREKRPIEQGPTTLEILLAGGTCEEEYPDFEEAEDHEGAGHTTPGSAHTTSESASGFPPPAEPASDPAELFASQEPASPPTDLPLPRKRASGVSVARAGERPHKQSRPLRASRTSPRQICPGKGEIGGSER